MLASKETVFEGNTLICIVDDEPIDGEVISVLDEGVDLCYLEGYKSRNEVVPWKDIVAKLDMRLPSISVGDGTYEGNFLEFKPDE